MTTPNNQNKNLSILNSAQLAWNQIHFLLKRFNFTSGQFQEEINYLNDPQFNLTEFTQQLLSRVQYLLILETYNHELHYLTNDYQVQGAKRLLRILELNNWLKLVRRMNPSWLDLWPYHLIQKQATQQLQKLCWAVHPIYSAREPAELPPTTVLPNFKGDFYHSSNQPLTSRRVGNWSARNS